MCFARADRHILGAGHVVIDARLLPGADEAAPRDGRGAKMRNRLALE